MTERELKLRFYCCAHAEVEQSNTIVASLVFKHRKDFIILKKLFVVPNVHKVETNMENSDNISINFSQKRWNSFENGIFSYSIRRKPFSSPTNQLYQSHVRYQSIRLTIEFVEYFAQKFLELIHCFIVIIVRGPL